MQRAEAGWYPDPEQPGQVRYFDGSAWTDDVRGVAPGGDAAGGVPPGDPSRAGAAPADVVSPATSGSVAGAGDAGAAAGDSAPGTTDTGAGAPSGSRSGLRALSVVLMLVVLGGSIYLGSLIAGDDPGVDPDALEIGDDPEGTDEEAVDDPVEESEPDADDAGDPDAADPEATDPDAADPDADAASDPESDEAVGPEPGAPSDGYDAPFPMTIDTSLTYVATISTTEGDIVLELDAAGSPVTTNNLVNLAQDGYYDGVIFHRVIEGFVIQGGDPTGTGSGGPGYRFEDELDTAEALVEDEGGYPVGTLAMANAGPDTNGSQFFIVHGDLVELPPAYTVFGQVTDGMDVVDAIATTSTDAADRPEDDITITTIDIAEQ